MAHADVPPAAGVDLAAYMRARVAEAEGQAAAAASGYASALAASPTNADIAERAYRQALAVGDIALATHAAAVLRGSPAAPADLPLLPLAIAARDNDARAANAAIAGLDKGLLRILSPALRGWTAYATGGDPFAELAKASSARDPIATRFALEQRALLQISRGDTTAGVATAKAALAAGAPIDLRLAAAVLLFGRDENDAARDIIPGDDPLFVQMRQEAHGELPTLAFGVSRLLARVAGDLAGQGPSDVGLALARTALIADPTDHRARLLLADLLARDDATDAALATLDGVKASSAYSVAAARARVDILARADHDAEALAAARTLAEADDARPTDWRLYGDRLVAANRYADAALWYARLTRADPTDWTAWLQYGGALEQSGDWTLAKPALERAVALAPREPIALNYLGYAQAERGEDRTHALALLQRASALKPDDLSIIDSLGWAYFLGGDTRTALPLIERAARGEPGNAEIGEHLGDAYWTLGRRFEARYAWRAAALTADPHDAARLADKLASGLPPRR